MAKRSEMITAVAIIGLTVVVGVYSYYTFDAASTPSTSPVGCNAPHDFVLVVIGPLGYNDSLNHERPWPLITVKRGDTVNLFLCNVDSASAHGFAIDHYLNGGVALSPGETFRVSFVANQAGNFTIYCNIFCPVHAFMLAQLRVRS